MVIQELGVWISYDTPEEDIIRHYSQEGSGLFRLGIPLCEGVRAIILLKRTIWLFVLESSAFDSAMELHQVRELNDRSSLFFDRAQYNFISGYMEEMRNRARELWKLSDPDTEKLFFKKSFYSVYVSASSLKTPGSMRFKCRLRRAMPARVSGFCA